MLSAFQYDQYLLKRQVLALTGVIRLYAPTGQLVLYSRQKMFQLKKDVRVYADESQSQELLYIQARQIKISAAYDVCNSLSQEKVGVLHRKGRLLQRDEWEVLDANDQPIGLLYEDDPVAAERRLISGGGLPRNYGLWLGNEQAAVLKQRVHLFRYEWDIDFRMDSQRLLDHRLGIAAGILLAIIVRGSTLLNHL